MGNGQTNHGGHRAGQTVIPVNDIKSVWQPANGKHRQQDAGPRHGLQPAIEQRYAQPVQTDTEQPAGQSRRHRRQPQPVQDREALRHVFIGATQHGRQRQQQPRPRERPAALHVQIHPEPARPRHGQPARKQAQHDGQAAQTRHRANMKALRFVVLILLGMLTRPANKQQRDQHRDGGAD